VGKKYLIDTNVLIEYVSNVLPIESRQFVESKINEDFNISVINRIEVLGHNSSTKDLEQFLNLANVIQLSEQIADKTILIRKSRRMKLPDAIIASTALEHNLTIISRNVKDFEGIPNLEVINPYSL
jgi:toxin FitB